jgi:hypothetical protein
MHATRILVVEADAARRQLLTAQLQALVPSAGEAAAETDINSTLGEKVS